MALHLQCYGFTEPSLLPSYSKSIEIWHKRQQPNKGHISYIVWWGSGSCGSQSWRSPASLTPYLIEPPLLLHQHSWACTAYWLTELLLPKKATFQLPELGLPWLHEHPYRWDCELPQLSSAQFTMEPCTSWAASNAWTKHLSRAHVHNSAKLSVTVLQRYFL